jgi:hypothetical protein
MREEFIGMARADFRQLDVTPLFDAIRYRVLTSVDRGHEREQAGRAGQGACGRAWASAFPRKRCAQLHGGVSAETPARAAMDVLDLEVSQPSSATT